MNKVEAEDLKTKSVDEPVDQPIHGSTGLTGSTGRFNNFHIF